MTTVIVQARIGSTRLKNKMLLELHDHKVIEWVLMRVKQCNIIDQFILAIPDTKENEILETYGKKYDYIISKGSEQDVLSRFYYAAYENNAKQIVRVCADNPLIAPTEIDLLIDYYNENRFDYVYNHIPKENLYPDGLGGEIVSFETLKYIYENAVKAEHREHVFNYVWDNNEKFNIGTFNPNIYKLRHPEIKLDVDSISDYNYLQSLPINPEMRADDIVELAIYKKRSNEV